MGAECNKVFLPICGRPLLAYTIESFARIERIEEMVLVVHPDDESTVRELMQATDRTWSIVHGGAQRRDSALAGVQAAQGKIVLIHDGARPFPSPALIDRVIDATDSHEACTPALPVVDTLRRIQGDRLLDETIPRDNLVRIQTPQGFSVERIRSALEQCNRSITDDAAAILATGGTVWTVPGESTNLKVTTRDDLAMADAIVGLRTVGGPG